MPARSRSRLRTYKSFLCDQAIEKKKIDLVAEDVTLYDVASDTTAISWQTELTTTADENICRIDQGDSGMNRDGDRAYVDRITFRGHLRAPEYDPGQDDDPANPTAARVVVVKMKTVNGVAPVWTDIFDVTAITTTGYGPGAFFEQPQLGRRRNFTFLMDRVIPLRPDFGLGQTTAGMFWPLNFTLRPKAKPFFDDGTTGLTADLYEDGVFMFVKLFAYSSARPIYLGGVMRVHFVG